MSVQELKQKFESKKGVRKSQEAEFLGEKVLIKQISAYSFAEYREVTNSSDPNINRLGRAKLVQLCMCDPETGSRIYDNNEVTQLVGFNGFDIDRIYDVCNQVNGYGIQGGEDILKNLLKTLGEDGLRELQEIINVQLQSFSKDTASTNSKSSTSSNDSGQLAGQPKT